MQRQSDDRRLYSYLVSTKRYFKRESFTISSVYPPRTDYFLKELAVSSRRLCRYSSSVSFFILFSELAMKFFSWAFSNLWGYDKALFTVQTFGGFGTFQAKTFGRFGTFQAKSFGGFGTYMYLCAQNQQVMRKRIFKRKVYDRPYWCQYIWHPCYK